jgi:hypothetical protein
MQESNNTARRLMHWYANGDATLRGALRSTYIIVR